MGVDNYIYSHLGIHRRQRGILNQHIKSFFFFFFNTGNKHIYKQTCIKHSLDIFFLVPVAYKDVVENWKVIGEGSVPGMHKRL